MLIFVPRMWDNEKVIQNQNEEREPGEATQYCIHTGFVK
jgi:hypothetical protein